MSQNTQNLAKTRPFLFPIQATKKPERRIVTFNPASQIRVLKARKLSDPRQLSTGFSPAVSFRNAEDLQELTSARQSCKRYFHYFFAVQSGLRSIRLFIALFQAALGQFTLAQTQVMAKLM